MYIPKISEPMSFFQLESCSKVQIETNPQTKCEKVSLIPRFQHHPEKRFLVKYQENVFGSLTRKLSTVHYLSNPPLYKMENITFHVYHPLRIFEPWKAIKISPPLRKPFLKPFHSMRPSSWSLLVVLIILLLAQSEFAHCRPLRPGARSLNGGIHDHGRVGKGTTRSAGTRVLVRAQVVYTMASGPSRKGAGHK